jgi:hypothetical protein
MLRPYQVLALRCVVLLACFVARPQFAAEERFSGLPVPDHTALVGAVIADGVQIYEGKGSKTGGFQWELKGPKARLTTTSGESFGHHDLGPTWTANDGSQVAGAVVEKVDAPKRDGIPWVLLTVKSKTGSGVLSDVDYVLRVGTAGGNPPAEAPSHEGETRQVPYHACYLFLKKIAAL